MLNQEDNMFSLRYIDLLSERLGGRALACSDEWFAACANLVKPGRGVFKEGCFVATGQWMDGWETRRSFGRRAQQQSDCDWCILRLGAPGAIRGFDIDTNHFRGNAPEFAMIEAARGDAVSDTTEWTPILTKSPLKPHSQNLFECNSDVTWTHLRLKIYPDGGVARLRVYGDPRVVRENFIDGEAIDLAAASNGGRGIDASDRFFSSPDNLIMPGRGINMGDGWETKRRRDAGHDWAIIKLGLQGNIRKVIVDTAHFKGNYPDRFSLEARCGDAPWQTVIAETPLYADREHRFIQQIAVDPNAEFSHVKLNIFPDGGVSRLRIFGFPNWEAL